MSGKKKSNPGPPPPPPADQREIDTEVIRGVDRFEDTTKEIYRATLARAPVDPSWAASGEEETDANLAIDIVVDEDPVAPRAKLGELWAEANKVMVVMIGVPLILMVIVLTAVFWPQREPETMIEPEQAVVAEPPLPTPTAAPDPAPGKKREPPAPTTPPPKAPPSSTTPSSKPKTAERQPAAQRDCKGFIFVIPEGGGKATMVPKCSEAPSKMETGYEACLLSTDEAGNLIYAADRRFVQIVCTKDDTSQLLLAPVEEAASASSTGEWDKVRKYAR